MSHAHLTTSAPARRHLLLTSMAVVGLHLALLGSPLSAVSGTGVTGVRAAPTASALPLGGISPESDPTQPSPTHRLSLRIWSPPANLTETPATLSLTPQVAEPLAPAYADEDASSGSPPEAWILAQATSKSEQSLRPTSADIATSPSVKLPNSARMQFDVLGKIKGFGYTVSGELLWQQDGRQYQSRFEIGMPLLGSRVQSSQGQIGAGGLLPTRFGDKVRSEQAAHFERDKGLISFSANTPSVPLEPGAQDRLSLFMQLAALLAGAPQRYPAGTHITLQIVSAREAEPWTFRVDGAENLPLPIGTTEAVRLTRLPREPYDQQVDLWFAPAMGYLPVRLRVTHPNGDVADQVLRRLDPPS